MRCCLVSGILASLLSQEMQKGTCASHADNRQRDSHTPVEHGRLHSGSGGGFPQAAFRRRDAPPLLMLEALQRTSFHHQPEAQYPKSSAIDKLPADYPIFREKPT